LYVASAEDVLISKLEWAKEGESQLQLRDAAGIIRTQGDELNLLYIAKWVRELGLETQWHRARELAD
jgi:hypothetical protein